MTRSRQLAKSRRLKSFVPKTALEKKLYVFYKKWNAWFDAEEKSRDKVLSEDECGTDKWSKWSREYLKAHPRPKVPKALRVDFSDSRIGSALGQRLRAGYYRQPKVVAIIGEYGTSALLIKTHADFGPVAVEIIIKWEDSFKDYPPDHTDRPPDIAQEVFDALPSEYGDKVAEEHKKSIERWVANEKSIAEANEINALLAKAKGGDQVAAAKVLYHHSTQREFYSGKSDPEIKVLDFENVEPS